MNNPLWPDDTSFCDELREANEQRDLPPYGRDAEGNRLPTARRKVAEKEEKKREVVFSWDR